ncbi:MAG TPA: PLP-dependent aminotransferase family protein [Burkholderiales bacterium]|nr:PLP-dependent aminotransferase family protein [Burkholderiales bacterium]
MSADSFDINALLRPDLPPAAQRWTGYPKYNFVGGHNDAGSVPVDDLIAAVTTAMKREGDTLAMYGLHSGPLGYRPLREFIARKLAKDAGIACTADEVLITSGSLQGLDLVNAVFLAKGDTAIVEEMTYSGTITRLQRLGVNVVGVPIDDDGLNANALAATLADLKAKRVQPKFIYTIPTVQNPTATVMSTARRREILRLSTEYGVPIFEDECYADLVWAGERPQALRGMAGSDQVVHIGSFSKSIAPALRLGYLVASWPLMSRILSIKSDGGSGAIEQMMLAEYCSTHFDTHVQALRKTLRAKVETLMSSLRAQFGGEVEFDDPAGGIFLWVRFPPAVDTTKLAQVALQAGVAVNPGAEWMTDADAGSRRVRICFAHPDPQTIREGVGRLAEICHREFGVPKRDAKAHR